MNFVVKLTVLLVVLVSAGNSFARSTTVPTVDIGPGDGRVHLFMTGGFDKSFKSFADNAQWILQHVNAVARNTFRQGLRSAVTWAMEVVARMEMLVMADGSHTIFPDCGKPEEERTHKIVAIAVSKLLRNLKTMERTDLVIVNVTRTVMMTEPEMDDQSPHSERSAMVEFLHMYFETMNHAFEHDHVLATEYKKQKAEAEDIVKRDPKMQEALVKVWEVSPHYVDKQTIMSFLRDKPVFREAYVNKVFMKMATKNLMMVFNSTHYEHYVYARALLKKAESSDFKSKINLIYHKALYRAGGMTYMESGFLVIMDVLFEALRVGVDADPALSAEIKTLMMEVERSTIYDMEMFHLDFSLF